MNYPTVTLFHGFTDLRHFPRVFHARTVKERMRGLIGFSSIGEGEAMVLHFEKPSSVIITNKEVSFPISILFLDELGYVIGKGALEAFSPFVKSCDNVSEVIEMPVSAAKLFAITNYVR
jgi:uncharacterized membrane protein (UPF0127 family)